MDSRVSAHLIWRAMLLGAVAVLLGACAAEVAQEQPAPTPQVMAAPAPLPAIPVAPEPPKPAEAPVAAPPPPPAPAPAPVAAPPPTAPPQAPPPAPAPRGPIEITGVEAQKAGADKLVVTLRADGPVSTYESFTLPDPPRLIVDIPNAMHAVPQPISTRSPLVTAIRSSQYREQPVKIVRVVVDLRTMLPYRVAGEGNQLRVQLGSGVAEGAPSAPTAVPAPPGKVTRVDLQSIRGRQRLVIGTSGRIAYKVTEAADPLRIIVDLTGAQIDPANARTLDLRQVPSSVNRVQASQHQTSPEPVVRVVAELRSPTRYDVQQTPSAILVDLMPPAPAAEAAAQPAAPAGGPPAGSTGAPSVAPVTAPPTPSAPSAGAPGRMLSMDFKDADILNLLRIIAEVSGKNVVAGGDVTGKVTVRLVNVDWEQALDVILKINGMGWVEDGNIIRVAPQAKLYAEREATTAAKKREDDLRKQTAKTQVELEPLMTTVIPFSFAKPADISKNLDRLRTTGRPEASVQVDERTAQVIINDTAATIAKMEALVKRLDIPTPQVLIEARIVEATRTFSQSLGVEYGFATQAMIKSGQNLRYMTPISVFSSNMGTALSYPTDTIPLAISFPAAGTSPVGLGVTFGSLAGNFALGVRLSAAEQEGRVRTLSAPKVATLDNQEAEIRQGTQVPYTTVDSSGRTVVAFQDAFIRMKVTPHITNDRRVSMKIEAERSFPGDRIDFAGGFAFVLEQRKASTNILISNGSTVVIGGLMQTTDTQAESGLPWLKNIPMLGMLFKNQSIGPNSKTELLIFLTPTILEEPRLS
jgi:type IV pilus assembly protein PilQ